MKTYAVTVTRVVTEECVIHVDAPSPLDAKIKGREWAQMTYAGWERLDMQVSHVDASAIVPATLAYLPPNRKTQADPASGAGTRPSGEGAAE